jgi:hypothetical protein
VSTHRHLDPRACDLAVALLGVAVAEIEQGAAVVDREVDGIADAGLGCVHVAAVLGGCDRAACLERRRDAEAGQEGCSRIFVENRESSALNVASFFARSIA